MKVANECTNIHAPSKTLRLQTGVDYHTLTSSQPRLLRQHGSMKEKAYALRPKKMVEQYDALYDDGWQVEFEWTSFKILRWLRMTYCKKEFNNNLMRLLSTLVVIYNMIKRNRTGCWLHTKWDFFMGIFGDVGCSVFFRSSHNYQNRPGVFEDRRCTTTTRHGLAHSWASLLHRSQPRTCISCAVNHMSHSVMPISCLKRLNNLNSIKLNGCHTKSLCFLPRVSRGNVWFERHDMWHVACP